MFNISTKYNSEYQFENPFFTEATFKEDDSKETSFRYMKNKDIRKQFNKILVLCEKNLVTENKKILSEKLTFSDLEELGKHYVIIQGSFKLLSNLNHVKIKNKVSDIYLHSFNHYNISLEENELIIPMIELEESKVKVYLKQFEPNTLTEYFNTRILNDHYHNYSKSPSVRNYMNTYLQNIQESLYWTIYKNTYLNMTEKFLSRDFFIGNNNKMTDEVIKKIAQRLLNLEEDGGNYLKHIYKRKEFIDASTAIKQKGYILYHIPKKINFSEEEIYQLYDSLKLEKDKYDLLNTLLVSKEYCHFVLNSKLLEKGIDIIKKYIHIFRYSMGYAFTTMYIEECIKKTFCSESDRFVFKLNTASKLPYFPFSEKEPKKNPYLPILVADKFLDSCVNVWSITPTKGRTNRLCTQSEFNARLNIFTTGDETLDLFKNLNWNNIAISGSLIAACVTRFNPLAEMFDTFQRYLTEYYKDSDIDMMINIKDRFKLYNKVLEIFNVVKTNILEYNSSINTDLVKLEIDQRCAFFVNRKFIIDHLIHKLNKNIDEIIKDLNTDEIKQIVYPKYILYKVEDNKKYDEQIQLQYPQYFKAISIENLNIYFYKTKKEIEEEVQLNKQKIKEYESQLKDKEFESQLKDEELENDEVDEVVINSDYQEEDDIAQYDYFVRENIKYKIISGLLPHNIEIFQTKYEPFFSTVSKFHLPCVRGYYNGKETLLLPSCVSANMTFMNIDYKYFAGSKDPIEIINKYRMRGYGTFLNDKEKIKLVEYSDSIQKWKRLYNLNKKSKQSVDNIFGGLRFDSDFFKPLKLEELSLNSDYKKLNFEHIKSFSLDVENVLFKEYQREFGTTENELAIFRQLYQSADYLKRDGYVKPLDKWWFDYTYNLLSRLTYINENTNINSNNSNETCQ
jgi:hypothetical protein